MESDMKHSFVDFAFVHLAKPKQEFVDAVEEHLRRLGLEPSVLDAYPHELSGGMRQRVTIALATICRPEFIIADEPTTALDVVVQKGDLTMIREVQRELGSSIIFVTHDMPVHANMADRLGIMYAGRLVEEAPTREVFARPLHPYTRHLIQSLPRIGDVAPKQGLGGTPPNLSAPPPGCRFHPRCPLAMDICRRAVPALTILAPKPSCRMFRGGPEGASCRRGADGESPMSVDLLAVANVMKIYSHGGLIGGPAFSAVDDVSFAISTERPEIFTIIGESGSGKTTLDLPSRRSSGPPSIRLATFSRGADLMTALFLPDPERVQVPLTSCRCSSWTGQIWTEGRVDAIAVCLRQAF
jgi:oligopeptide/dipeptide ABC transporter ATP-binding protein